MGCCCGKPEPYTHRTQGISTIHRLEFTQSRPPTVNTDQISVELNSIANNLKTYENQSNNENLPHIINYIIQNLASLKKIRVVTAEQNETKYDLINKAESLLKKYKQTESDFNQKNLEPVIRSDTTPTHSFHSLQQELDKLKEIEADLTNLEPQTNTRNSQDISNLRGVLGVIKQDLDAVQDRGDESLKAKRKQIVSQTEQKIKNLSKLEEICSKIEEIERDSKDLQQKARQFSGSRQSQDYFFIDEMLMRNIVSLDKIDTGTDEELKKKKKDVIKFIHQILNQLDKNVTE